jgi:hypothetical protein
VKKTAPFFIGEVAQAALFIPGATDLFPSSTPSSSSLAFN